MIKDMEFDAKVINKIIKNIVIEIGSSKGQIINGLFTAILHYASITKYSEGSPR